VALATLSAQADTIYNTLDTTVDSQLEVMNLAFPGANGTTNLQLQIDGHKAGDHPGCNLNGSPHFVQLAPASSNSAVATAAFTGSDRFTSCSDVLPVSVTPLLVGTTTISFTIVDSNLSNDPHLNFNLSQASFTVNVSDGTITPVETGCDADPAAPAWAAAILQANNIKPGSPTGKNVISQVAHMMGNGATFGPTNILKNAHTAYEDAVYAYVGTLTTLTVPLSGIHRPGWECTTV
jgi:hypothetical protein